MFTYAIYSISEEATTLDTAKFLLEISDVLEVAYDDSGLSVSLEETKKTLRPNQLYSLEGYSETYIVTNNAGRKEVLIRRVKKNK